MNEKLFGGHRSVKGATDRWKWQMRPCAYIGKYNIYMYRLGVWQLIAIHNMYRYRLCNTHVLWVPLYCLYCNTQFHGMKMFKLPYFDIKIDIKRNKWMIKTPEIYFEHNNCCLKQINLVSISDSVCNYEDLNIWLMFFIHNLKSENIVLCIVLRKIYCNTIVLQSPCIATPL